MMTHDDSPAIIRFHKTSAKIPREDRSKPKGKRPWREAHNRDGSRRGRRFFFE